MMMVRLCGYYVSLIFHGNTVKEFFSRLQSKIFQYSNKINKHIKNVSVRSEIIIITLKQRHIASKSSKIDFRTTYIYIAIINIMVLKVVLIVLSRKKC